MVLVELINSKLILPDKKHIKSGNIILDTGLMVRLTVLKMLTMKKINMVKIQCLTMKIEKVILQIGLVVFMDTGLKVNQNNKVK